MMHSMPWCVVAKSDEGTLSSGARGELHCKDPEIGWRTYHGFEVVYRSHIYELFLVEISESELQRIRAAPLGGKGGRKYGHNEAWYVSFNPATPWPGLPHFRPRLVPKGDERAGPQLLTATQLDELELSIEGAEAQEADGQEFLKQTSPSPTITEFFDAADASAHDQFQAWRTKHQDGVFLTMVTRARAHLHGARCQHLGSGPPYFSSEDGFGSLTTKRKLCAPESELLAWASAQGVGVSRCRHCTRDGFLRPESEADLPSNGQTMEKASGNSTSTDSSVELAARLHLPPEHANRMLRIFAESARTVEEHHPEWYRLRLDGPYLRLFCGHLIVMTLEGKYVWLAIDPQLDVVDLPSLRSWHPDLVGLRPKDATGASYPEYKIPPSINGFYSPADDPLGAEWQQLRSLHLTYLSRAASDGRAPDPRTIHDPSVAEALHALTGTASPLEAFDRAVSLALQSDPESRRQRLQTASVKPSRRIQEVSVFDRNPDVVAEVLFRAAGNCETCGKAAPFLRARDGKPYLEVHHKVWLSKDGDDSVDNAVALCPNCHRQQHFG